jgi:hypothetical protein
MGLLRGVDDSRLHRHNLEAEGLRTSRSGWGNRWGNETLASAVFPNEINSLGRRFVSHQPPHYLKPSIHAALRPVWVHDVGAKPEGLPE